MYLLTGALAADISKIERNYSKHRNHKSEADENDFATNGRRHSRQAHWLRFGWLAPLQILNNESGFPVPCRHDGRWLVFSFRYIRGKTVTPSRNGDDVAALVRAFAQSFPQSRDIQRQVCLLHFAIRPEHFHQLVFFKHLAVMLN